MVSPTLKFHLVGVVANFHGTATAEDDLLQELFGSMVEISGGSQDVLLNQFMIA